MFLELLLGTLVFLAVWDYFHKKQRDEIFTRSQIPGPQPLPLIGNALELRGVTTENMFEKAKQNVAKYGKIYRLWVLHQLTVIVVDVKYLEAILSSQQLIKKSITYDFLEPWLGRGLLLSTGSKWHRRRKIITPTFHFKILEQFVEVFDQQSAVMAKKLYERADGKTAINIFPLVCLSSLDSIAETAMGVKVHAQEHPDFEYVRALAHVAHVMANRFIRPLERTDWLFRLSAPREYRKMMESIRVMHDFTNKVIEERRAALERSLADGSFQAMSDDVGSKRRLALLDVLLQSTVGGQALSNEDIREEVDTFMFEGHDTTTSGISFCLYLIARHPAVQAKLFAEIREVLGDDKERTVALRDLGELKYLECVIKESLRLYPSVPLIGRETTDEITLGDVTLPAHTNLTLSLFMALRDPDHFPDPDKFVPERFSLENSDKINPFAYTPFSAGPRNCIGQKFAMLEMKSTVSKVLRHFELLPLGPEVRPMINLIMRSVNGVHVGLKPRTY